MTAKLKITIPILLAAAVLNAGAQSAPDEAQLYVATTPAGAAVLWDGIEKGLTPITLTGMQEGPHLLTVRMEGHETIHQTVTVEPARKTAIQLTLKPLAGLVVIHSRPNGASIEIDGADRGKTPVLITDLPFGRYRVRAGLTGFVSKEVDLNIDGRTPQKINIELPSDSGTLVLASDPDGASVTVNGIAKGVTPMTVDRIPEGDAVLELAVAGCEPYRQTIKLAAGETQELRAVLKPIPATLKVVSIPPGARIYIQNQFKGESPVTITDLPPGEYRVRAELVAHNPMARTVTLTRAQEVVEEFRLESNSGLLELITEPAGVKVFVDGKEQGETTAKDGETDSVSQPLQLALLSIGDHEVQLVKQGYFEKKFEIVIEKLKTVTRHERLEKRFIPDYEVTTPSRVYRGVLKSIDAEGTIRLEIRPGVIQSISTEKIRGRRPIRSDAAEAGQEEPAGE